MKVSELTPNHAGRRLRVMRAADDGRNAHLLDAERLQELTGTILYVFTTATFEQVAVNWDGRVNLLLIGEDEIELLPEEEE